MAQAKCSVHGVIDATWKEGVSKKTGKQYGFWSCNNRMPDGGFCTGKVEVANTPSGNFEQSLDKAGAQMDQSKKDETITRTAIAKSMIEAGRSWCFEAAQEAENWVAWCQGRKGHVKPTGEAPAAPQARVDDVEVELSDIPF